LEKRRIYRFGPFGLDSVAKVLLRDGQPVHLTRKAAETLLLLVEQSPQVVTKEELLAAVWPGRVVDEANLTQNIAVVRRALETEKGAAGYIETFPGRGYRLLGPVTEDPSDIQPEPEPAPPTPAEPRRFPWPAVFLVAFGLAVVAILAWQRSAPPVPALHITPVSRLAGKEYQPALSPDGSSVAFIWQQDSAQSPSLWIQRSGESSPRQLSSGPYSWSSPAWSPDSRSIACLRFGSSAADIVILSLDGRPGRVVGAVLPTRYGLPNRHLDWSPDGRFLAVDDAASLSQPLAIFLISLDNGQKTRLTQPEDFTIGDISPSFSPDGRSISFIRAFHRAWQELCLVPTAGGGVRQLTSDNRQVSSHDWSAADGSLAFSSSRGGEFRIWRFSPLQTSHGPPQPTGVYAEFPIQFTLAKSQSSLVYAVVQSDPNIWRLDFVNPARWQRIAASSGQDASPQYSPDGARIAFRSDRSGDEQIWIAAADGSNPVQATRGDIRPSVARWSPDGHTLVFNDSRTRNIYTAADGTGAWKLKPFGAKGIHPVFSLDGASIFAASDTAILRYPASGGAPSVVTPTRALSLGISPGGEDIYFVREPTDTSLSRVRIATGAVERVLEGLVPYCTSCWALAPNGIYYLGARPQSPSQQSIYFFDFAARAPRLVADYPEPILPIGIGPFSLSPDRKSLLTVRLDPSNSDLFRVDGFR
jgi:Tol biopolymer transport system component/DNA-binding winged helix-turn-helix (wHTH) protein